jgi:DNA-binding NarL/FixJ family response regulator
VAQRTKPEIAIMDVVMPRLNGVDATRKLVAELPAVRVIGLSGFSDERHVVGMFEARPVRRCPRSSRQQVVRASAVEQRWPGVRASPRSG